MKHFIMPLLLTLLLSGCARDVNLAKDVDLLVSPPPAQTNKPVEKPMATLLPTPLPSIKPTPVLGVQSETATVSGKVSDSLVDIKTSKGVIRVKLYSALAPNTVKNFLSKAKSDYYKGLKFHRVEDWVIQGGDPKGTGTGGGTMPTELNQEPFKVGSLGVARGMDIAVSNDSQFFICTDDCSWLTGKYTNFGEVVNGMNIATQIQIGDLIQSISEVK